MGDRQIPAVTKHESTSREHRELRDCERGGLLRKNQREFPNTDDQRVDENRKHPVLEFAREVAADPRIGTEQREFAVIPSPRNIRADRQNRELVIIIPIDEWIVRQQQ